MCVPTTVCNHGELGGLFIDVASFRRIDMKTLFWLVMK